MGVSHEGQSREMFWFNWIKSTMIAADTATMLAANARKELRIPCNSCSTPSILFSTESIRR